MGSTASVTTGPDNTIWVIDRCGNSGAGGTTCGGASATINPIFQFDTSGKLLKTFGAGMFVSPHKLTVDEAGNLWVADNGSHQIFKMDRTARAADAWQERHRRTGHRRIRRATEVAVASNGDIFVADGHTGGGLAIGNARVVKFDRNGKFLKTWGKKGMGRASSTCRTRSRSIRAGACSSRSAEQPHPGLRSDGKFVAQWFQFGRPSGMYIDRRSDTLYVADSNRATAARTRDATRSRSRATASTRHPTRHPHRQRARRRRAVVHSRPVPLPVRVGSSMAEGVTVDSQGNVYGADFLMDVRKFVPTRGRQTN